MVYYGGQNLNSGEGAAVVTKSYLNMIETIEELECTSVPDFFDSGGVLIDVREAPEVASGRPEQSLWLPKSLLELKIQDHVQGVYEPIALICGSGQRSRSAAAILKFMGYQSVVSVRGGVNEWRSQGLPIIDGDAFTDQERERYSRHLMMPTVGPQGQSRLKASKVLVVGAGGLGSPAALYLAGAGVGTIGLVDDDRVDRSNLQRQILHGEEQVGWPKVASGVQRLSSLNPDIRIEPYPHRLEPDNVHALVAGFDLVLDGTDNLKTRYLLNGECVKQGKPYVYGAVYQFEGQVGVFAGGTAPERCCYACFHPEPPPAELTPTCAEAGVLGVLPGIVGALQALEAIKWLLGMDGGLVGQVAHLDAMSVQLRRFKVPKSAECTVCLDPSAA